MKQRHAIIAVLALTSAFSSAATIVREMESDADWYAQHLANDAGASGSTGNPDYWTNNYSGANNLLTPTSLTSSAGVFQNVPDGTGTIAELTNGISGLTAGNKSNLAIAGAGSQVVFTFAATALSSIQYYGGWVDGGRSDALFNVSYSTDNGANYTLLTDSGATYSVVGDPARQNLLVGTANGNIAGTTFSKWIGGAGFVTNYVSITDSTGSIGSGALVTNLKFDFFDGRNGYNGVMELAAYAVPEPSLSILGFGALALLARRKR